MMKMTPRVSFVSRRADLAASGGERRLETSRRRSFYVVPSAAALGRPMAVLDFAVLGPNEP